MLPGQGYRHSSLMPAEREYADRAISNGERKDTRAAQSLEDRLSLGLLAHAGRVADPRRAGTQDGAEKSSSHGMEFLVAVRFLAFGMGLGGVMPSIPAAGSSARFPDASGTARCTAFVIMMPDCSTQRDASL